GVVFGTDPESGYPDPDSQDMLLIKLDSGANELWRRSYGSSAADQALAIAVHPTTGTITLIGRTDGRLGSDAQVGGWDPVILNLDADGSVAWSRQFGTTGNDFAPGVVLDPAGNVYTTGTLNESDRFCTSDCSQAFMTGHSPAGQLDWFE